MGQIVIKAWGSMNPENDKDERVVEVNHSGTYAECVKGAREALDQLEWDLRVKLGDSVFESE